MPSFRAASPDEGREPSRRSTQLPSLAVVMLEILVGLRTVAGLEIFCVPIQFFSDAVGDIAEQGGFGERAGVVETAGGRAVGLAGLDPFIVVTDGFLDE